MYLVSGEVPVFCKKTYLTSAAHQSLKPELADAWAAAAQGFISVGNYDNIKKCNLQYTAQAGCEI